MIALRYLVDEVAITVTTAPSGCRSARACCSARSACSSDLGRPLRRPAESDAPAGETLGVGLASGLMVLAAWWAAIASGGRSSFTPVAVGFAIAIGLAVVGRAATRADGGRSTRSRRPRLTSSRRSTSCVGADDPDPGRRSPVASSSSRSRCSTARPWRRARAMASSRVEFSDEAFYAVLGADLATTGTETHLLAVGFIRARGPAQPRPGTTGASCGSPRPSSRSSDRAARRPPLRRPAGRAAGRGRVDRHARPPHGRDARRGGPSCSGSSPACSSRRCR